jgi:hypothetical protein
VAVRGAKMAVILGWSGSTGRLPFIIIIINIIMEFV